MTRQTGTTTRLDADRLELLATQAMADRRIDLGAVRERARRRPGPPLWLAAAAAVLVGVVVAASALALDRTPQPARPADGPGALPATVYAPPRLPLLVTEHPIARVALVLAAVLDVPDGWGHVEQTAPVLVSADGAQYRRLPTARGVGALALSADGTLVVWADRRPEAAFDELDGTLRWVDVGTGREGSATFDYPSWRRPAVDGAWVSPDGARVVVEVGVLVRADDPGASTGDLWEVDPATGVTRRLCSPCRAGAAAFDPAGRFLVAAGGNVPDDVVDGVLPDAPGSATTVLLATPPQFAGPGGRRLDVTSQTPSSSGLPEPHRLVEVDADGREVRSVPLGTLTDAAVLAWSGDTAWVRVADETSAGVRRVDLATGRATAVLPYSGPAPTQPYVVLLAGDVAAAGVVAPADPPVGTPWWSPASAVLWLPGPVSAAVLVALLVGFLAVRRRAGRAR